MDSSVLSNVLVYANARKEGTKNIRMKHRVLRM